jgi:hypothetical protein
MKRCYKCDTVKPYSEFHKASQRSDGYNSRCKECQYAYNKQRYDKDPEAFKLKRIKARYNLTPEQYYEMTKNGCEVCGSHKLLHIDHDHSCCGYPEGSRDVITCGKCIRGVLCKDCNTAEGLLHSSAELAIKLAGYMKRTSN